MDTRRVGTRYENRAAEELERLGYGIIEKNYHCKYGEIDIVARDGEYLVFVEVKYRKNADAGDPMDAVNYRKIKKICATATYYMMQKHVSEYTPVRFDVVSILGDELKLIKNAFEYTGR
ncbi:MAG: YraN family protein [Lachnospiraceae bacterium]|nr:YraN family protein [Lachnospiraceae bacterium]